LSIPFTTEQFLEIFRQYNTGIWPAQVAAYFLAVVGLYYIVSRRQTGGRVVGVILGIYWVFMGAVYHLAFFSEINRAAGIFGIAFIIQGLLFFGKSLLSRPFAFSEKKGASAVVGWIFIIYGMIVYPMIGMAAGHGYPEAPMFGVAPCPTTIFTFGVLLLVGDRIPWIIIVIPFLWSLVGTSAAVNLGIYEDFGLGAAGIIGTAIIIFRNRRQAKTPVTQ